ncbi:ABC transporter ATP-binding protein [Alkalicoccobacillus plakortidis]|uniref:ABC transporter ATP-binding protein n=1 Tax=Alkalicoccobacillus plakortidis TaxID=444060 RepID=A0ABT0XNK5_9BACI|nr:ABC transporter ATP-binding protein [Alkalicoccobacillus plakortidis]MCM2677407.1 ABC transporter ATP-binding protein [Alkalicoccobacillus plakortidis]
MIYLRSVSKSYKNKQIFNDYTISIEEGEFVSIMGQSGSGKTTLLNLMSLIDKPDSGDVEILKHINPKNKMLRDLRRNHFGFIFQNYVLLNEKTIFQNLLISKSNITSKAKLEHEFAKALESVQLDSSRLHQPVYELSGGEQQRLAIARVILKPFSIIFADEPTGNLDDENKQIILDLFKQIQSTGKTIVSVTHDSYFAEYSDRIIKI